MSYTQGLFLNSLNVYYQDEDLLYLRSSGPVVILFSEEVESSYPRVEQVVFVLLSIQNVCHQQGGHKIE